MRDLRPFADSGPIKVPDSLSDEQVLFLGDVFPTGWQAAVQCDIEPYDTVAVWGAGAVGQFAIRSAVLLGARKVIAIDRGPERRGRHGGARHTLDRFNTSTVPSKRCSSRPIARTCCAR